VFFHASAAGAFLLSLRGPLHPFFGTGHYFRTVGFGLPVYVTLEELQAKFDAILYVDQTTPTTPFPPPG